MSDLNSINERVFGYKLTTGTYCAPGTLMHIMSGAGTVSPANNTAGLYAHGVATTSGSGTKVAGISQYATLVRCARVVNSDWNFAKGSPVYLGTVAGAPAQTGTQKIGFALDTDEVFIDLDLVSIT
jgi:hypothetical protein